MSDSIIAYRIMPSLDHWDSLPEDPMDREYGEAENLDALTHNLLGQEGCLGVARVGLFPTLGQNLSTLWVSWIDFPIKPIF
jgi:hypothetical protein